MSWRSASSLAVLAVALVGCSTRFYALGHDALWSDELFTASMVLQHPLAMDLADYRRVNVLEVAPEDVFLTAKAAEQSPPLFELCTKVVVVTCPRIFGPLAT